MPNRYSFRRSTLIRKLPPHTPWGSPRDPTPRIKLDIEGLDLTKSYVTTLVPPQRPARAKKNRPWPKWTGAKPLTDPAQFPAGWHMNEDDLEIDDIDGQIQRCHERIAENIMPRVFQQRLAEYTAAKAQNDLMNFPGSDWLSWDTIERVHTLEAMKTDLANTTDKYEQLPNIDALLNAYKAGQLWWNTGFVTYWSRGAQICQPRPFDWDEFEAINTHYKGDKGFWAEGISGPGNESSYTAITLYPTRIPRGLIGIKLALRLPGVAWFAELDFIYDTGANMMSIFEGDLSTLLGPHGATDTPKIPVIGLGSVHTGGGTVHKQYIEMEVTILDGNRHRMTPWTRTICALNSGDWRPGDVPRLDGPIVRDLLYTGSAPNNLRQISIATTKSELNLIDLDLVAHPPHHNPRTRFMAAPPPGTLANTPGSWSMGVDQGTMPPAGPGVAP
ncbi:hypothetical protein PENNAL_c0076G01082 [Penicillium nalgiovense]|uniref:Uncharacterized protein n=1 Tax=Penicillium nalgiovense TaxID=60175 RepID=A0A1V6XHN4_PENNA|nr:hypothetical protein PENNAL_c0076G01082 [Penicillium nalgiovense]CAG8255376.1 unnamed protein product [Penicillium nalgiovense]